MANSILVAFMVFAATWRSARNISSDFRVPQSTNIEALLLVSTQDLQTPSDRFDCSELLDYCKTRGTQKTTISPLAFAGAFEDSRGDERTGGRRIPGNVATNVVQHCSHNANGIAAEVIHCWFQAQRY
jgi:hypothetical protein